MLYYKIVDAKDGKKVKNYYLTRGDTFPSQIVIKDKNKNVVDPSLIDKVLFKLSDIDYNFEYEQEYEYDSNLQKWTLEVSSPETKTWVIDTHIYEYEITYKNGKVSTPVQAKFTVLNEIKGE